MSYVDVIIPICRTARYLRDLFESMSQLNFGEHQIMFSFVFDHSDKQEEDFNEFRGLIEEYSRKWSDHFREHVQWVVTAADKNLGLAGARNTGIRAAQNGLNPGEYIIWMDSDDIFLRDSIVRRVDFMNEHPDVDFAYGSYLTFKDGEHPMAGTGVGDPEIQPFDYAAVLQSNQFSTCAGIIRADKFIPFDERARVAEDYVWVLSHLHEYKWQFIPDLYCFYYRIRPDSLSNDPEAQKLHYANVMRAKRTAYRTCKAAGLI